MPKGFVLQLNAAALRCFAVRCISSVQHQAAEQ